MTLRVTNSAVSDITRVGVYQSDVKWSQILWSTYKMTAKYWLKQINALTVLVGRFQVSWPFGS